MFAIEISPSLLKLHHWLAVIYFIKRLPIDLLYSFMPSFRIKRDFGADCCFDAHTILAYQFTHCPEYATRFNVSLVSAGTSLTGSPIVRTVQVMFLCSPGAYILWLRLSYCTFHEYSVR